jgi:hypothetical protein
LVALSFSYNYRQGTDIAGHMYCYVHCSAYHGIQQLHLHTLQQLNRTTPRVFADIASNILIAP